MQPFNFQYPQKSAREKIMKSFLRCVLFSIAFLSIVGWGPFSFFTSKHYVPTGNSWIDQEARAILNQASNIDPYVLKLSLTAYSKARTLGMDQKGLLTIIDYSKPSTERRLWVVDLNRYKVLYNTWVTHGKNSGQLRATSFSNEPGSLKSTLGVFLTENPYIGNNGYSLRLIGLERGINDNAYRRDIVIHGAWYATENVARQYGQLGRSWGCPAVDENLARPLIDTIKGRTLLVAYYPDRKWLNRSPFLVG